MLHLNNKQTKLTLMNELKCSNNNSSFIMIMNKKPKKGH